jgi:hypothetical protein
MLQMLQVAGLTVFFVAASFVPALKVKSLGSALK